MRVRAGCDSHDEWDLTRLASELTPEMRLMADALPDGEFAYREDPDLEATDPADKDES